MPTGAKWWCLTIIGKLIPFFQKNRCFLYCFFCVFLCVVNANNTETAKDDLKANKPIQASLTIESQKTLGRQLLVLLENIEKKHSIPHKLLTAIAWVESGRRVEKNILSWPWTINFQGKGYVFATKKAAIQAVRKAQKKGIKSIDVGVMQVNLYHHPHAFKNLEQAFDPSYNVAYAVKFLKQLYKKFKSWELAVGHYHSATPIYNKRYRKMVMANWHKLVNSKTILTTPQVHPSIHDVLKPRLPAGDLPEKIKEHKNGYMRVHRVFYPLDGSPPIDAKESNPDIKKAFAKQKITADKPIQGSKLKENPVTNNNTEIPNKDGYYLMESKGQRIYYRLSH